MHSYKDTPMGKAMKVAIMVISPKGEMPEEDMSEDMSEEEDMKEMPKGKKPKDAVKLPKGYHYMPDGKVMADSEMDSEDEYTED
jgi:hypothetical protein